MSELESDQHPGQLLGIRSLSACPEQIAFVSPSHSRTWQCAIVVDGVVFTMNRPNRHGDIVGAWCEDQSETSIMGTGYRQGFLTPEGEYLTRHEALRRYEAEGSTGKWPPRLYSEDLWTNHKERTP